MDVEVAENPDQTNQVQNSVMDQQKLVVSNTESSAEVHQEGSLSNSPLSSEKEKLLRQTLNSSIPSHSNENQVRVYNFI